MVTVSAHFDGKVIVPDEPLDVRLNQPLIVRIEEAGDIDYNDGSALSWLVANAIENDTLPVDLADRHDRYLYGSATRDQQA